METPQAPVLLTALILTKNAERLLANCLDSLAFCDAIFVLDSFSTDATEAIARAHGAYFVQNPWPGFAAQAAFGLNWLMQNAPTKWVLYVDSDEICSPALRQSVQKAVQTNTQAWQMRRVTWYYNRFLEHGDKEILCRLFRPEAVEVQGNTHVDFALCKNETAITGGQSSVQVLEGPLWHYGYTGFFQHVEKLNQYAENVAGEMLAKGKKGGLFSGLFHAWWRFLHQYIFRLGFLDGKAGFYHASHVAFYTFSKYIRMEKGNWNF